MALHHRLLFWSAIAALAGFVYFPLTQTYLTLGDNVIFYQNTMSHPPWHWFISEWSQWMGLGAAGYYRPLQVLLFYPLFYLFEFNPLPYGLLQISLIAICSIVLFESLRQLVFADRPMMPFILSLLFAFHISTSDCAVFLTDNASFFQTLIVLALITLLWRNSDTVATTTVLCGLCLFLKESGFVILAAVAAYVLYRAPAKKQSLFYGAGLGVLGCAYLALRHWVLAQGPAPIEPVTRDGFFFFTALNSARGFTISPGIIALYNVVLGSITMFIPFAGGKGEIVSNFKTGWAAMAGHALLLSLVLRHGRSIVKQQKMAVFFLLLLAGFCLLSFPQFRYRMKVIAEIAYIFLIGLALVQAQQAGKTNLWRRVFAVAVFCIIPWSMLRAYSVVSGYRKFSRQREPYEAFLKNFPIKEDVAQKVHDYYFK